VQQQQQQQPRQQQRVCKQRRKTRNAKKGPQTYPQRAVKSAILEENLTNIEVLRFYSITSLSKGSF